MKTLYRVFCVTLVALCAIGVIFMVSFCFDTHSFLTKIDYKLNASGTAYTVTGIGFQGSKRVDIPAEHKGKPVTAIDDAAFAGCYGLKTVTIPATVTKIGENPFDSTIVESVRFEGSVEDWCKITFESVPTNQYYLYLGGTKVVDLEIPSTVTKVNDYAFAGVKGLKTISLADSVTEIGKSAFDSCYSITSVTLGNGVTQIGSRAFYKAGKMTSITFGSKLETIGSAAFDYCDALTTVSLPDSLKTIEANAFDHCRALTDLKIGENVEELGNFAFDNCAALTQIEIPVGVTTLPKGVFAHCSNLTSIDFHEGLEVIGESAFSNCYSLTSVTIPGTVTMVGKQSFQFCTGLTSVSIAAEVETGSTVIGEYAFQNAEKIETIVVGNGVIEIQQKAFSDIDKIKTLVLGKNLTIPDPEDKTKKTVYQNAFYKVNKTTTNVYFLGTEEDWTALRAEFLSKNNANLVNAQNFSFYSETQPTEEGNFWHYVNGVPTVW